MVFTVSATNPITGLTSTATVTVNVTALAADFVTISSVSWTSVKQNRGKLNVVAITSATLGANGLPPPGLQLYVQATGTIAMLVPDGSGGLNFQMSEVQMAATPLPMFFAPTGNPAVCPIGYPSCWQFVTAGTLLDPNNPGVFMPPDSVTVTSSFGGISMVDQNNAIFKVR
jgi:hypothetical protein